MLNFVQYETERALGVSVIAQEQQISFQAKYASSAHLPLGYEEPSASSGRL